jgi:thioredoxin 1
MVERITSSPFKPDLSDGIAIVKFAAGWCGPCRLYAPAFERVALKNPDARFYDVDIDQCPDLKESYGVETIPTTIFLKDGVEVDWVEGAQSTGSLDALVKGVLSSEHANSA